MTNTRDWLKEALLAERAELAAKRLTPRQALIAEETKKATQAQLEAWSDSATAEPEEIQGALDWTAMHKASALWPLVSP